jgi:hypothetical protein
MKVFFTTAACFLLLLGTAAQSFAAGKNLVAGVGPVNTVSQWSNYSALNVISGTDLFPVVSKTTVLYVAFTSGTEADIGNMVLYKTASRGSKITAVTPVTFGGISNPIIHLTDKTVCKIQPVSLAHPCIVRLDALTLTLSAASDYYFVTYFSSGSNNGSLGVAGAALPTSSITGWYMSGDQTQLTVGKSIPAGNTGKSNLLVAVSSN